MGLFWDLEVTPEDEEMYIRKIAEVIHQYGMEVPAILFLESTKPLAYIGGQLGRFFVSPFLPIISEEVGIKGEKFFMIFEKRGNVEKLIQLVEEMAQKEKEKTPEEAKSSTETHEPSDESEEEERPEKKGWRRFLPF